MVFLVPFERVLWCASAWFVVRFNVGCGAHQVCRWLWGKENFMRRRKQLLSAFFYHVVPLGQWVCG